MVMFLLFCFFCFKQKTAYEMRISDWSSDVCSSDLPFDMALPSFAQHLKVLEDCGLIASEKRGRSRWCRLERARFDEAANWMEAERRRWADRLDRLETYLDKTEG